MTTIPISKIIRNPEQPRRSFDKDELNGLAQSIQENGQIQAIAVEENGDSTYTLIDGERRWLACKIAGLETIEATVRERSNHGGREMLLGALVANIQREDMNPIDEALAYQRLKDEFGMTLVQIQQKTGKAATVISSLLSLLKFEPEIQELVRDRKLSKDANLTRAIQSIPDPAARVRMAQNIVEKGLVLPAAIASAKRLAEILLAPKLHESDSPALDMVIHRSGRPRDEEPTGWNAMRQLNVVPPWGMVTKIAVDTCGSCSLKGVASKSTCGPCPLVDYLRRLMAAAHD